MSSSSDIISLRCQRGTAKGGDLLAAFLKAHTWKESDVITSRRCDRNGNGRRNGASFGRRVRNLRLVEPYNALLTTYICANEHGLLVELIVSSIYRKERCAYNVMRNVDFVRHTTKL